MRADRLRRLTMLTQGVALIGLAGCSKEAPIVKEPTHVNAPAPVASPEPAPTTTATAPEVASGSPSVIPDDPDPPHVNSPAPSPPKPPKLNSPNTPPSEPKLPKHTNSPG